MILSQPQNNEIEVSIFGGGIGESIVIHLGESEWMIVDSCLNPKTMQPVALEYLKNIGVDVVNNVKFVVATHWHDDHVKGISQIVKECVNAQIVFSEAIRRDEFAKVFSQGYAQERILKKTTSGVKEFYESFKYLRENKLKHKITWAGSDRVILNNQSKKIQIFSLSPSDMEKTLAYESIAQFQSVEGHSINTIPDRGPNHTAIVLLICLDDISILLGSDLEESSKIGCGWSEIIQNSQVLNGKKARIFKVPHHGSQNAHHDQIWSNLLESNPFSILTPFTRSKLPREDDIKRILELTNSAYCTSDPRGKKPKQYTTTVEKMIKQSTKSHKIFKSDVGQIRYRYNLGTKIQLHDLNSEARKISEFLS